MRLVRVSQNANGRTYGHTDTRTDGRTGTFFYRDATAHLKMIGSSRAIDIDSSRAIDIDGSFVIIDEAAVTIYRMSGKECTAS